MSLKSVNWSNEICVKILHFYKSHEVNPSRDFSLQIGKHLFAVVASGISSIRYLNKDFNYCFPIILIDKLW